MYAVVQVKNRPNQGQEQAIQKDISGGRGANEGESDGQVRNLSSEKYGRRERMKDKYWR